MANFTQDFTSSLSIFQNPEDTMESENNSISHIKRNITSEFYRISDGEISILAPPPSNVKETVNVYLRVKPKTSEELEFYSCRDDTELANLEDDQFDVVKIESQYQIALNAPKDSNTFKNSVNGAGALCHRFVFNKIFPPETQQEQLFLEMVKPKLMEFLEGQNQLLFTYGATSSGKTFTIQGDARRPGIIPRALDSIFNSVGSRLIGEPIFKPSGFKSVERLDGETLKKVCNEKTAVLALGKELTAFLNGTDISTKSSTASMLSDASQNYSQASHQSLATMFPQFFNRLRETLTLSLPSSDKFLYSVWVSFAEIYNENIYDLLEKMPEAKRKGEKVRRVPLKLAEESGCVYIKGLKEICVSNADEAYQLMMIGTENLQFAATRLNHNSSRSHCIFTVKVVKVVDRAEPNLALARVSMLSFCDLAGSERIKKTQNTGDRQKEAGNINSSLLVLGRCIKAIRHNQLVKDVKKHQIIPFRDSKLTRLFQSFFNGRGLGKASMVVNLSQSPYLFDESLQVLKFAAITSRINIEISKINNQGPYMKNSKKRRQSQFSMIVLDKKSRDSLLNGCGSIAWEKPMLRSTLCPAANISQNTICEENETEMDSSVVTVSDRLNETELEKAKYAEFLEIIDQLKNELIKEKQNSEKQAEEIRRELNGAYDKMIVDIDQRWGERLQGEKDRMTELSEWRIQTLQDALKEEQMKKRKRRREDDENESDNSETLVAKLQEAKDKINQQEVENQQLEKQVSAMKSAVATLMSEKQKSQEELSKKTFEVSNTRMQLEKLEAKVEILEGKLLASNEALSQQVSDPKIKNLEREVSSLSEEVKRLKEEKSSMKTLLDEAGKDFLEKTEEVVILEAEIQKAQTVAAELRLNIKDLELQSEEYRLLCSNANFLNDEKDATINDYEEKIQLLEEKLESLNSANKWGDKKSIEQQLSALNDEVESLTQEKKKLRSLLDAKENEAKAMESKSLTLQSDFEQSLKVQRAQVQRNEEIQAELEMMKKQAKDFNLKISEVDMLSRSLKDKQTTIEQLQASVDSMKRDGKTLEGLKLKLSDKVKDNLNLNEKVLALSNDVTVLQYDLAKIKAERDDLMNHYSDRFKKLSDELMAEKSETEKLRSNLMTTVNQQGTENAKQMEWKEEALKLRSELKQKSELIQNLTNKIAPVNDNYDLEEIKEERDRLALEIENLKSSHVNEIQKVKKSYEKIMAEFKDTNASLLKNIGGFPDNKPNIFNDSVEGDSAQGHARASRVSATTQVSFQDSPIENQHPDDTRGSKTSPPRRISKRGTRVSGTRPSRSRARPRATCSFTDEDDDFVQANSRRSRKGSCSSLPPTLEDGESFRPLKELQQFALSPLTESPSGSSPTLNGAQTRGRKKLFRDSRIPESFTPPEVNFGTQSARSIVQRELRSKRLKKN